MHGRGAKRRTSSVLPRIPHVTHVSSRRTCQEVPYQGGSGGSLFLLPCYKKSSKRVPKKGPLNRQIPLLNFTLEQFTFGSFKNQACKTSVDSSSEAASCYHPQKSIISTDGRRTNGHQIWMCSTDGKSASRNNVFWTWYVQICNSNSVRFTLDYSIIRLQILKIFVLGWLCNLSWVVAMIS